MKEQTELLSLSGGKISKNYSESVSAIGARLRFPSFPIRSLVSFKSNRPRFFQFVSHFYFRIFMNLNFMYSSSSQFSIFSL